MAQLAEEIIEQSSGLLRVKLPEVDGNYELTCAQYMVQAVGVCATLNFYFRAKYGSWEFELEDDHGHPFPYGDPRRFVLRGTYDESKPGAMGMEWAARLLRKCLADCWGIGS